MYRSKLSREKKRQSVVAILDTMFKTILHEEVVFQQRLGWSEGVMQNN